MASSGQTSSEERDDRCSSERQPTDLTTASLSEPAVLTSPPPTITLPAPLLRYRCTQMGCCCGDWAIPLLPEDVERVRRARPDLAEEDFAVRGPAAGRVPLPGTGEALFVRFEPRRGAVGRREVCRLLTDDGGCSLHAEHGLEALPYACALFPVRPMYLGGRVELGFALGCPGVLHALFGEPLDAMRLVPVPNVDDPALKRRLEHATLVSSVRVGERELPLMEFLGLRDRVLEWLADPAVPPTQRLGELGALLAALEGAAAPEDLTEPPGFDEQELVASLVQAAEHLSEARIAAELFRYRAFVRGAGLEQPGPPEALMEALGRWPEHLSRWLEPHEEELRPYLLRFLWARVHGMLMPESTAPVRLSIDPVLRTYALGLRVAAALGGLRQSNVTVDDLRLAFGLAAFVDHVGGLRGARRGPEVG